MKRGRRREEGGGVGICGEVREVEERGVGVEEWRAMSGG